jgi:hypothetical protein
MAVNMMIKIAVNSYLIPENFADEKTTLGEKLLS